MKKHLIAIATGLTLWACGTPAGTIDKKTLSNLPSIQDLIKSQSIKPKPLPLLIMGDPYKDRQEVSLNWHKVVVTFSKTFLTIKNDPGSRDRSYTPYEFLQLFTDEIRQRLEAFEERYNVRVIWKMLSPATPDVTAEFLRYADTPQSQKDICRIYRDQERSKLYIDMIEFAKGLNGRGKSR